MTISQGGNVGIGLTNPAGLLDVNSKFVVGASSITGTLVNAANGLISFDSNRDIPHLRPKAASANLRHSHDSLSSAVSTSTYELLKTMTFTYGIRGTLRIAFRLVGSGGGTSYARVYKNGSPIGTVQTQNGSTSSTKTEDINVGSLSSGGTLEVWGSSDEFGGQTTAVQEFRIYYDNAADTVLVGGVTTS
ncbi:MAG: hypothetical protein M5U10_11730 [Candidatus Methanoperedens sp.]|nr:hypothetical protein [Candidatus Methanoperedens nitroreducens]MDJ1422571.1 hypothetical protein [Candidatus Methanoperedens sp.]